MVSSLVGIKLPVMAMHELTLQIYTGGKWQDAMRLGFEQPDLGLEGACTYGYEQRYLVDALGAIGNRVLV